MIRMMMSDNEHKLMTIIMTALPRSCNYDVYVDKMPRNNDDVNDERKHYDADEAS